MFLKIIIMEPIFIRIRIKIVKIKKEMSKMIMIERFSSLFMEYKFSL